MGSISRWLRSEADAVPVALILLSSPQMPLTTLRELRAQGFSYLPDPERLISGDAAVNDLSDRMKKVLDAAVAAQRSGSREILEDRMRDVLAELSAALETADYNISNLYTLVSTFTSTLPVTIVATLALVGGGVAVTAVTLSLVGLLLASVSALLIFPWEFGVPTPRWTTFLPLLSLIPLYAVFSNSSIPAPLLLSLAVCSTPSAIAHFLHTRRELRKLEKAREMVRAAAAAVGNPYYTLVREGFIEDPEDLLSEEWRGFARAAALGLWQILLHGGYENLHRLDDYLSRILEFVKRLRSKTRTFMVYAFIEAAIVAAVYAFVLAIEPLFAGGGEWMARAGLSLAGLRELREWVDAILAVGSTTLAVATAGAREGRPHLLTMYLPFTAGTTWLSWVVASTVAPALLFAG